MAFGPTGETVGGSVGLDEATTGSAGLPEASGGLGRPQREQEKEQTSAVRNKERKEVDGERLAFISGGE